MQKEEVLDICMIQIMLERHIREQISAYQNFKKKCACKLVKNKQRGSSRGKLYPLFFIENMF